MNWALIAKLSLFGLAMGVATVFWIPSNIEPIFWLGIFLVSAYVIASAAPDRAFQHGVALGLANSVWIVLFHVALAPAYMANHPQEVQMMASMPMATHPRLIMAVLGPVIGLVSGLVIGLLALGARTVTGRK